MKYYKFINVVLGLFMLLFINVNINAQDTLSNFTRLEQVGDNTCWAACICMVMKYYGVERDEEEVVRFAFKREADAPTPDSTRNLFETYEALRILLLGTEPRLVYDTLAPNLVTQIISDKRPVISGLQIHNKDTTLFGHMVVIVGYTGRGGSDIGNVVFADPLNRTRFFDLPYSEFVNGVIAANSNDTIWNKWTESIYMLTRPPARKQTIVGKLGSILNTITAALKQVGSSETIVIIDAETYEEQITIDGTLPGVNLQPTFINGVPSKRPRIKFYKEPGIFPSPQSYDGFNMQSLNYVDKSYIEDNSAVRLFSTLYSVGNRIHAIDIEGNNAVCNSGLLYISSSAMSAVSDNAIYNSGTIILDDVTVSTASDVAIYNTGTLELTGETVLSTAIGSNGIAIYNSGSSGLLALGGSLTITGRIEGFSAGRINVYTSGTDRFNPGSKKYLLAPANLTDGGIVVFGGADYIDNFSLTDSNFVLAANGNNLVAKCTNCISNHTVKFDLNGGTGTVPDSIVVVSGSKLSIEQMPIAAGFTRTGYTNDGKWYTLSNSQYSEFMFGVNGTSVTGNTTLYLQWTVTAPTTAKHTVSFNLNGGTGIVPADIALSSNGRLSLEQMPSTAGFTRTGYTNDGKWYTISNNSKYTEFVFGEKGTMVNGNATLYLKWTNQSDISSDTRFAVGPNPVSKQAGVMNFFWDGEEIKNGNISIFNSTGSLIRKINIKDNSNGGLSRRVIGSWDLNDQSSRPVPVGSYLVIGEITTKSAKKESVSVMTSVR